MIASYVILKYGGEPRPQGRPRVGHDEGQHPDRSHQLDSRTDQKRQERSHAHHQRLPDPFAVVQQFAPRQPLRTAPPRYRSGRPRTGPRSCPPWRRPFRPVCRRTVWPCTPAENNPPQSPRPSTPPTATSRRASASNSCTHRRKKAPHSSAQGRAGRGQCNPRCRRGNRGKPLWRGIRPSRSVFIVPRQPVRPPHLFYSTRRLVAVSGKTTHGRNVFASSNSMRA